MQHSELLEKLGFPKPNPMQAKALAEGFLDSPRCVVSAPTASGKTLLALMAIADNHEKTGKKAVYVVPLRALAAEKHEEFKEALHPFGITVGLSTGELDSSSEHLHAFDVVVCTSEKMDSLFRHGAPWLKDVGLAVIDEVHLLGDGSRGATLEVVLTKLLQKNARLLCLSGTIPNAAEVAAWLKAKLVESDYRPTPLQIALCDGETLYYSDEERERAGSEEELVKRALAENNGAGQALVFVATRRNAEALAKELSASAELAKSLKKEEKQECVELARRALHALGTPTSQCKALAGCMENGVAFHHAGLVEKQRRLIEQGFKKDRCLKAIVCTTTLAMGIDYPASWVIVRDLKRYNGAFSEFIPALEVAQITGRAGRPRYDKKGMGVLCCKPSEKRRVAEKYVLGGLENLWSQLSNEALLRTHCLGLIASKHCSDRESLYAFFGDTLYAHQYGDTEELLEKVESVVEELKEMNFVREKGKLVATPAGKRASELYIDPLTAHSFVKFLENGEKREFDYLLELNKSTEARPLLSVGKGEENALWEEAYGQYGEAVNEGGLLEEYKSAKLLNAWVNEATEEEIMNDFQLPPGVVHARARNMEWLCYALQELAFLLNRTREYASAKRLRKRIKHGIKEELLDLCSVRGIGRVRGRRLWNAGVKTQERYAALSDDEKRKIIYGKANAI